MRGMTRSSSRSIDDHFAHWGAVCLTSPGWTCPDGARASAPPGSSRLRSYTSCGFASLRQTDLSPWTTSTVLRDPPDRLGRAPADPRDAAQAGGNWIKSAKLSRLGAVADRNPGTTRKARGAAGRDGLPTRRASGCLVRPIHSIPPTFPGCKPPRGEGGNGVRKFDNRTDLDAMLPRMSRRFGWPLLVQDYIPGIDIDLSALADHGRITAWTIQKRHPSHPDLLEFVEHPRVLEIGADLIRRCGYHGIVHFDMRLDERTGEPIIIEANPRFWSSIRHSMWMGVNFPALGIDLVRGGNPAAKFQPAVGLCRDPGLSIKSTFRALVRGHWGPEGLSQASSAGWHSHLRDPRPKSGGACTASPFTGSDWFSSVERYTGVDADGRPPGRSPFAKGCVDPPSSTPEELQGRLLGEAFRRSVRSRTARKPRARRRRRCQRGGGQSRHSACKVVATLGGQPFNVVREGGEIAARRTILKVSEEKAAARGMIESRRKQFARRIIFVTRKPVDSTGEIRQARMHAEVPGGVPVGVGERPADRSASRRPSRSAGRANSRTQCFRYGARSPGCRPGARSVPAAAWAASASSWPIMWPLIPSNILPAGFSE